MWPAGKCLRCIAINLHSIMHAQVVKNKVLISGEIVPAGNLNPLCSKILDLNIIDRNIAKFYIFRNVRIIRNCQFISKEMGHLFFNIRNYEADKQPYQLSQLLDLGDLHLQLLLNFWIFTRS
jgi:hypothetical protein